MVLRLVVAVVIVAIAVLTQPFMAGGQNLQLPARFHGTVGVGCYPVPDGTVIEAEIAGDTFYTSTSWAPYGDDDYAIMIIPPEGTAYVSGTPVYFKIGDRDAPQVGTWEAGGNVRFDLTYGCLSITTIYPSDDATLVAVSSDGISYGPFKKAVASWNPGPPTWPDIEGATWISSAYHTEVPERESWRKFELHFEIPEHAADVSGILQITADRSYRASINGILVESEGLESKIETVDVLPVPLVSGENTLTVIVWNGGRSGLGKKENATGLIYSLTVRYGVPPGTTLASVPQPTPIVTVAPAPEPTMALGPGPTASPTVASGPVPTARPYVAPTRQYAQGYEQSDAPGGAQGGGANMSKVVGVAFFGMLDVVLIGLLVYLVWRFFLHPRVET